MSLTAWAQTADDGQFTNQASYTYAGPDGVPVPGLRTSAIMLIDPRGQVRGCNGALLPDYAGFGVGLYESSSSDPAKADLQALVALTRTGDAGSGLPLGVSPNTDNSNPFPLSDATQGMFSFLLDPNRGQLDAGHAYILVLTPPSGSGYRERRVLLVVGQTAGGTMSYTATSLDGEPVSATDGHMSVSRTVAIQATGQNGLSLVALNLKLSDCAARPVQITKTGDRAAAEPGDTVVYRVAVRNGGTLPLTAVVVTDTLPLGFDLRADSVRAEITGQRVVVGVARRGRQVVFTLPATALVPAGQTLSIAYAALLTPDALRGDGQNSANVTAQTTMTMGDGTTMTSPISDGPAIYGIQVRDGLLSDTGTLIGRVFEDLNDDDEQERGEPGIPNVTVLLDDSTEVVTDINGLFSIPTVTPGYHTATLDFRTAPGYVLARNHRFIERRTPSRLVHLEPGGLARVNFGLQKRSPAKARP